MRRVAEVFYFPAVVADRLVCSACGAEAKAACTCGVNYVPKSVRADAAIKENPQLSNVAIAKRIGVDEATVRRARKRAGSARAEPEPNRRFGLDGKSYPKSIKPQPVPTKPAKPFKPRTARNVKAPVTDKDHLIAFTRELSQFVMHFSLELTKWLDTKPTMEAAGRDALARTLEAYSMQLQRLAQRVDDERS